MTRRKAHVVPSPELVPLLLFLPFWGPPLFSPNQARYFCWGPNSSLVSAGQVAVLFIHFQAGEGRDFALLIQSVGMSAASASLPLAEMNNIHIYIYIVVVPLLVLKGIDFTSVLLSKKKQGS